MSNPIFDAIKAEILHPVQTAESWFERHDPPTQTPAPQPVNLAVATAAADPKGTVMSLATIADDIKNAITSADEWAKQAIETHLPALAAEAAKYENSPIVQALEKAILPPQAEAQIVGLINFLASLPAAQQAAPATDAPAEPAPAQ